MAWLLHIPAGVGMKSQESPERLQEIFCGGHGSGKWIAIGTVDCMQMNDAHASLFAMGACAMQALFECE
ncbi:hypothetical protein CV_1501 [Chromobacterium violaceum ATCC 12472]|uniref:Uncharacterized protein n=1 Tax=Chromobacterium violaceum (strain ATCC 12472 / DSM 30191 / JCM 1249 / CCUG 213 / NBRC 12614 / NCIMB 9131 / NCTC 9757 / MK) TaxID=243365 RepID=Q7NXX5_CHRVO|nr:hypothetical protein CV_1501 [Chromobacterium violaceum ATCC 12472]